MLSEKRKSEKNSFSFWALLLEVTLIIVGVFLGVAGNGWLKDHSDKKLAKTAVRYISTELKENQESIEKILPYHRSIRDSLQKLTGLIMMKNAKLKFQDLYGAMPKGFRIATIQTTGWDIANRTGAISIIDFDLTLGLSKVYNLYDFCQSKVEKISENFYIAQNVDPEKTSALIVALGLLASDIVVQEERLIEMYPEIIKQLEKYKM